MKILVTGATGMVGSELTRQLVAEGLAVRILHRRGSDTRLLHGLDDDLEFAIGDVRDADAVEDAVRGVEGVYHSAAYVGFGGKRDRQLLLDVNVQGTANVVNAALRAGVSRLVHTSSVAAFGRPERPEGIIDETSTWRPSRQNTLYAHSKYLSELEVYRGIAEGLDAVMVNPGLIFGRARPGENTAQIVESVASRRMPGLPAGGTNVVDVRDVAHGHRLAMLHGRAGERYFLGGENLSWTEIIGHLAEALGVEAPGRIVPPRLALALATAAEAFAFVTRSRPLLTRETARTSSRFYRYSNSKAVEELGCTFRPFRETATFVAEQWSRSA